MQMEGSETQIITLTVQNYLDHRLQLFAIPNYINKNCHKHNRRYSGEKNGLAENLTSLAL